MLIGEYVLTEVCVSKAIEDIGMQFRKYEKKTI